MLADHQLLKAYATSIDPQAAAVHLRLQDALQAAEARDQPKFEKLAHSIKTTLDEIYASIFRTHKDIVDASVGTRPPKFTIEAPDSLLRGLTGCHDGAEEDFESTDGNESNSDYSTDSE